jgi:CRP-like cAMP-binding protein
MAPLPAQSLSNQINAIAPISALGLELLFSCARQKRLARGKNVLEAGQVCRHIYLVESGYLRCFYNKDGKEINLQFALENAFVTDLKSLRGGIPSEYTIQAAEPASLWLFGKEDLLALYQASPEIESFGRRLLEELLMRQEEHSRLFTLHTPLERYQYLARHHAGLLQRVSLSQLSSYLGMARETLSRIRKQK